jgi:polar amino acid transport system permease protein
MAGPTGGAAEIARAVEITAEVPQIEGTWRDWRRFPYWLVGIAAILAWIAYLVVTQERYQRAWDRIVPGIRLTIEVTIWGFAIALAFGMILGLGRIARNVVIRNLAIFYIEFIRGVPILVLIFTIAYAVVPTVADALGFSATSVDFKWRAIIALALIYAAYLAEVFRAGIESISKGQTEAGRALGMSHSQTLRRIVLPQAVRNITPALGNDAIAMLKDTSLVSVLAVRDITQNARIYAGSSFDFKATYPILLGLYLSMTILLSLALSWYRRRLGLDDRG